MSEAMEKLKIHKATLLFDSAMVAIDSLLDVMKEVGEFSVDVSTTLGEIKMSLRGSPESDDREHPGTTGPVENAGE